MQFRPVNRTFFPWVTAIVGLAYWVSVDPVQAFRSVGPGTQGGAGIPQSFSIQDFHSVRRSHPPFPSSMAPGVLSALGGCVDSEGNLPNSPLEYDLSLRTDEDTSTPWDPGDVKALNLILRSSSIRWVITPPRVDVYLVGGHGRDVLVGGLGSDLLKTIADGTSNTILFAVPDVPAGLYRFHVFERATGLCKASDFVFQIGEGGAQETPTPTPTESGDATPTPTRTPGGPTPTLRMPDYDNSHFVNAIDLPDFLERLIMGNEDADLDGLDGELFRDFFMFSLWWQSDQLRDSMN